MTSGQTVRPCLPEITKFKQHGQSGAWVSDFMSHTAAIADELCFVKSMYTTQVNHAPAICFFLTGSEMPGRPSAGAWLTYGLGSETEDLPGFVVMTSRDKEASCGQIFYDSYWGSGFPPTKLYGVKFCVQRDPVLSLSNPDRLSNETRRALAFGRLSPEDAAVFCALAEETIGSVRPLVEYIRDPSLLPKGDSARWFVLDCIRQFVRDGKADDFEPRVINRFLRGLSSEHQLTLLTDMVEKWGSLGADRAMLELLRKVAAA